MDTQTRTAGLLREHRPLLLAAAAFTTLVVLRLGGDPWNLKRAGIQLSMLELLALGYHVRAATRRGQTRAARRSFWLISLTLVILMIAGAGFSVVFAERIQTWTPAMVLAIVARLAIIPVLLSALLSFAAEPIDRRARWKLGMDVTTVLGAGLMLMWYVALGPALKRGNLLAPLPLASVLFSIGDVILLVGVGTVLMRGSMGAARRPLLLLLAGTLSYLALDMVFLYQSARGEGPAAIMPTLMIMPIFLILLAAIPAVTPAGTTAGTPAARPLRCSSWLPYLALAGGYGLLVLVAIEAGVFPWLGLVTGALLMTLGVAARQIVASRENYSLIVTDTLTGLANRRRLAAVLAMAVERHRRTGTPAGVLLIDLDGFKQVNDVYGHETGDQMLAGFAELLRGSVRAGDVPARLGGDEFAVVLPGVTDIRAAIEVAERVLAACRPPLVLPLHTVQLRASIGIAVTGVDDADPHELLHRADQAMYAAKRRGDHGWAVSWQHTQDDVADVIDAAALRVA